MNAENAKLGIRKIYRAQILSIFVSIFSIAGAIAMIGFGKVISSGGKSINNTDVVSLIVLLASMVLGLIAFILNLRGIMISSKDEPKFKEALASVILGLVASILAAVFSNSNPSLSSLFESASNIAELFTAYYIIRGCINLARQNNDEKIAKSGKRAIIMNIIALVLAAVLKGAPTIIPSAGKESVKAILSLVSLVLTIIAYVVYLKVLRRTSDIL